MNLEQLAVLGILSHAPVIDLQPIKATIMVQPIESTINLSFSPSKAFNLNCSTNYGYNRLDNGLCSFDYRKRVGIGEIEVKGYKELTDKGYAIGMRYRIEW